jgi:hypothetical protein
MAKHLKAFGEVAEGNIKAGTGLGPFHQTIVIP